MGCAASHVQSKREDAAANSSRLPAPPAAKNASGALPDAAVGTKTTVGSDDQGSKQVTSAEARDMFVQNPSAFSPVPSILSCCCWSADENLFFAGDERGGVSCWGAGIPFQKKWTRFVPQAASSTAPSSILALFSCASLDRISVLLVIDTAGNVWQVDVRGGSFRHLANVQGPSVRNSTHCAHIVADGERILVVTGHRMGSVSSLLVSVSGPTTLSTSAVSPVATLAAAEGGSIGGAVLSVVAAFPNRSEQCFAFASTSEPSIVLISFSLPSTVERCVATVTRLISTQERIFSLHLLRPLSTQWVLITLDHVGVVTMWSVPYPNKTQQQQLEPKQLAMRSVDAVNALVSHDERYLFVIGSDSPVDTKKDVLLLDIASDASSDVDSRTSCRCLLATVGKLAIVHLWESYFSTRDPEVGSRLQVASLAQSVNRLVLLLGATESRLALIDLAEFVKPELLQPHKGATVAALTVPGPTEKFCVSGGEDTSIQVSDLLTGRPVASMVQHTGRVWSITQVKSCVKEIPATSSVRPPLASTWMASGSEDGTLRIWTLSTGKQVEVHPADQECVWSVVSEDGAIFTGGAEGSIRVWLTEKHHYMEACEADATSDNPSTAPFIGNLRLSSSSANLKRKVAIPPKAEALKSRYVCWARLDGHKTAVSTLHAVPISSAARSSEALLISGSFDGSIRLWHLPSKRCVAAADAHKNVVWSICSISNYPLHRLGETDPATQRPTDDLPQTPSEEEQFLTVFTASEDQTVRSIKVMVESVLGGREPVQCPVMKHTGVYEAGVAVSSTAVLDPRHIACGTSDGTFLVLHVDETGSFQLLMSLSSLHSPGTAICSIVSAKSCILTGGVDGTVRYSVPWPALLSRGKLTGEAALLARQARIITVLQTL